MKNRAHIIVGGLLGLIFLSGLGCQKNEASSGGGFKVRIPSYSADGKYHLQSVELKSIVNLTGMTGNLVEVKAGGDFGTIYDQTTGAPQQTVVEGATNPSAHFLKVGDTYHPSDFLSMTMAVVVHNFERIAAHFQTLNGANGLLFPVRVFVDTHDYGSARSVNNAKYSPDGDFFVVNPYDKMGSTPALLPLSFNLGIMAHEHVHRLSSYVWNRVKAKNPNIETERQRPRSARLQYLNIHDYNEWGDTHSQEALRKTFGFIAEPALGARGTTEIANIVVQDGFEEGIADYLGGYRVTGQTAFFEPTIPSDVMPNRFSRNLAVAKNFPMASEAMLAAIKIAIATRSSSGLEKLEPHELGAVWAHFLWVVEREWGPVATEARLFSFMETYDADLQKGARQRFISMSEMAKNFLAERPASRALCSRTQGIFAVDIKDAAFECGKKEPSP